MRTKEEDEALMVAEAFEGRVLQIWVPVSLVKTMRVTAIRGKR